jgi:hypothetical protein
MSSFVSTGSDSLWIKTQKNIVAGDEIVVDAIRMASFRSLKYILCCYNKNQDKTKFLEMSVINESDNIRDSICAKIGSVINLEITAEKVLGFFNLKIKNNESYDVKIDFAKLILGS